METLEPELSPTEIVDTKPVPVGPKTIRAWVADGQDDAPAEQIVSYRIQGRERRTQKWETLCEVRVKRDQDLGELLDRLEVEVANQTAKHMQVQAFRRNSRVAASVFPIIVDIYGPDDDDAVDDRGQYSSEKAYAAIIKLTLSHNDKMVNALLKMSGTQGAAMATMINRYEAREERVQRDHMEALDALHTLSTSRSDDNAKAERWTAGIGAVKDIAAAVVTHVGTAKAVPDAKSKIMSAGLRRLGESFTDEQVAKMSDMFTPQQAVLLQSLLQDPDGFAERVIETKENKEPTGPEASDDEPKE